MWVGVLTAAGLVIGLIGGGRDPGSLTPLVLAGAAVGLLIELRRTPLPRTLLFSAITLGALALAAVLIQAWLVDQPTPTPRSVRAANGVVVAIIVAATLIGWIWWRRIAGSWPRPWVFLPVAFLVAIGWILTFAILFDPPRPRSFVDAFFTARFEAEARQPIDLIFVVDAGDRSALAIAKAARDGLARPPGPRFNLRIAVLGRESGPSGRWAIERDLTHDRGQVAEVLAKVRLGAGGAAYGSYAALIDALLEARSRRSPHQVIALIYDRLPGDEEIFPGTGVHPTVLKLQLSSIAFLGRAAGSTRLVVVSDDRDPVRRRYWAGILKTMGGFLVDSGGDPLLAAERAATDPDGGRYAELAFRHRPHLHFDAKEWFGPLDVDQFLAEGHRGCQSRRDCSRRVHTGRETLGAWALDLAGEARYGGDLPHDLGKISRHRIYFRALPDGGATLHLDYWWFLRFNVSPVATDSQCLAGVGIRELTCFDHEGDWEGVTVSLKLRAGLWKPSTVTYSGHHWEKRYRWEDLIVAGAIRDRGGEASGSGTHPAVYVAYGSHASYPLRCDGSKSFLRTCNQGDKPTILGRPIPEGRHNGARPWPYNSDRLCEQRACVVPLPRTPTHSPASWNAFGGTWGKAECTFIFSVCVLSDGPRSPRYQPRYQSPGRSPILRVPA